MPLEQDVMVALKTAMLNKDEVALRSLRAIEAAILLAKAAEGAQGELDEACGDQNASEDGETAQGCVGDLSTTESSRVAAKESEEIAVIERFLPQPM
jgi:uncharacterized protein YqeY